MSLLPPSLLKVILTYIIGLQHRVNNVMLNTSSLISPSASALMMKMKGFHALCVSVAKWVHRSSDLLFPEQPTYQTPHFFLFGIDEEKRTYHTTE